MLQSQNERRFTLIIDADENADILALLSEALKIARKHLKEDTESETDLFKSEGYCAGNYYLQIKKGPKLILEPGDIDRKFEIQALSRHSGKLYTHAHGVFFKAEDAALPYALSAYIEGLRILKAGEPQIQAMDLLTNRVIQAQQKHGFKVPDVDPETEPYLLTGGIVFAQEEPKP